MMQPSSALRERPFPPDDARSLVLLCMTDRVAIQTWIDAAALFAPVIRVVVLSGESRYAATCRLRPNLVVEEGRDLGEPTPGFLFTRRYREDLGFKIVREIADVLKREFESLGRAHLQVRPAPPDRRTHVLLVDDEVCLLLAYQRCLQRFGRQVRFSTARDGLEAIEIIQRDSVDLLLTNYRMPKMDGVELLRWVRTQSRATDLLAVVLSGSLSVPGAPWAELGVDRAISKPVSVSDLRILLSECLERATGVPHPYPPQPVA